MMVSERKRLTALRRELKSAGKDRRKEIQLLIKSIESEMAAQLNIQKSPPSTDESLECEATTEKITRQKERKEKAMATILEKEKIIAEARKRILEGPQHDIVENDQLCPLLTECNLVLHHIPPDGNCLFAAVSHQLSILGKQIKQDDLRILASDYIRAHPDIYSAYIDYREYEASDLDSYCHLLGQNGWWGGEVELHALSEALQLCISVFKFDGVIKYNEKFGHKATLNISYHRHQYVLGAHYNSLVQGQQIGD